MTIYDNKISMDKDKQKQVIGRCSGCFARHLQVGIPKLLDGKYEAGSLYRAQRE